MHNSTDDLKNKDDDFHQRLGQVMNTLDAGIDQIKVMQQRIDEICLIHEKRKVLHDEIIDNPQHTDE